MVYHSVKSMKTILLAKFIIHMYTQPYPLQGANFLPPSYLSTAVHIVWPVLVLLAIVTVWGGGGMLLFSKWGGAIYKFSSSPCQCELTIF